MTRIPPEPSSAIDSTENVRRLASPTVDARDQRIEQSHGARLELIDGIMYELPMTSFEHGHIASLLVSMLVPAYQLGRGGPGGWWIQGENDFCANGSEVFRPDALGWRRERLVGIECDRRVEVVPDWVCEVLSPSTRTHDLETKARAYSRIGVRHGWYVEPSRREVTVYEFRDGEWYVVHLYGEEDMVQGKPFDALSVELASLWANEGGAP